MAGDPDNYRLSAEEHREVFERDIAPDIFAGAKMNEAPTAIVFGGQPGAGKSAALDAAVQELASRDGVVQIIGDDLRAYHRHYAALMRQDDKLAAFYTGLDSGRWVEMAIAIAANRQRGRCRCPEPLGSMVQNPERMQFESTSSVSPAGVSNAYPSRTGDA